MPQKSECINLNKPRCVVEKGEKKVRKGQMMIAPADPIRAHHANAQ